MMGRIPLALTMAVELGIRGFNPRLGRLVATSAGLAFAIVLIAVQASLTAGFVKIISGVLDNARADLWIVPRGTTAFDEPSFIDTAARFTALKVDGVAAVSPLLVGYTEWRSPSGAFSSVIVLGSDIEDGPVRPWNIAAGSADVVRVPWHVAVDVSYAAQLGITGLGSEAMIDGQRITVGALTSGIRSFTTSPYVFTSLQTAHAVLGTTSDRASYAAVRLADPVNQNRSQIAATLARELPAVEILTPDALKLRNLSKWLLETGAGAGLLVGTLVGLLVGVVIITQTLSSTLSAQRAQLATLRAMGASNGLLAGTVLSLVAACVTLALLIGSCLFAAVWHVAAHLALPLAFSVWLAAAIVAASALMGALAGLVAVRQVLSIDPALVFAQ